MGKAARRPRLLDISALAQTSGSGDFEAYAHVDLAGQGWSTGIANAMLCGSGFCVNNYLPATSAGTKLLYLATNTDYEFLLNAVALAINDSTATAMADPTVTFDPNFNHPSDAQIMFSDNLPNTTAAPEPASWAMMVGGFGIVGLTTRRRRVAMVDALEGLHRS